LGEYIPFEQALGHLVDRLSPLDAHLIAGRATQLFETPFGRAIVGICYESAFAKHFRRQAAAGGQFILTASNNAHYSETMPAQHHAQDVMRAIETDRWAVRATNTGYSGIVDPTVERCGYLGLTPMKFMPQPFTDGKRRLSMYAGEIG
jgi:apolipoprotein N-acyltransferase